MLIFLLALLSLFAPTAFGQAPQERPVPKFFVGSNDPGRCTEGDFYYRVDTHTLNVCGDHNNMRPSASDSSSGGVCVVSGTQSTGYVLTATDNATGCDWEAVGGATVDANTLKNAWYIADGGSANGITGTPTTTFPGAYAAGQAVLVKMNATNSGATTIDIASLGTKAVTKNGAAALAAGNLVNGRTYLMVYDGTRFQVGNFTIIAADVPTLNQDTTGKSATADALAVNPANCSPGNLPRGVDASGVAEGCAPVNLATETTGPAPTAAALAANPANCNSGNLPRGVDASGAAEGCNPVNLATETIGAAPTANALAANPGNCSAGNLPRGVDASGVAEGCAPVNLATETTGPAPTATALAANGANCASAGTYPNGVDASGVAENCTKLPQQFFGTAAPGSVAGNLPGDLFSDTTNHNSYWCGATSGTAAPACTSVTTGGWTLLNAPGGSGCTSAGSAGTAQGADGSGGCEALNAAQNADGSINATKAITWAAASSPTYNAGGTTTCDWSASNTCLITMSAGNTTLALTNPHGSGPYRIIWVQDTTTRTVTFPGSVSGGVQPDPASGAVTIQDFTYVSSVYNGTAANVPNSSWHGLSCIEGTAPAGVVGTDLLYCDSATHRYKTKDHNGTAAQLVKSGVDIDTSDQVTATHLSAALPRAQGGTNNTAGTIPQQFFGTAAPGSVSGNLPGDFFSDTTNHNDYWCNATSATAAPACTSVTAGGWTLLNGAGGSSYTGSNGVALNSLNFVASRTKNAQTNTTYTVASTDCGNIITSFNASAATLYTLPQAGTASLSAGCVITIKNIHTTGLVEVDTSTSTFLGNPQTTRTYILPGATGKYNSDGTDWVFEYSGPRYLCNLYSIAALDMLSTDGASYNTTNGGGSTASTNIGTTETAFAKTCTIPANMITTSTLLRVTMNMMGTASASPPTQTWKFRATNASGTTFMVTNGVAQTAITTSVISQSFNIMGTAAPSGSSALFVSETSNGTNFGDSRAANLQYPTAMPTNAAIILAITLKYSAATALNLVNLAGLTVEVVSF